MTRPASRRAYLWIAAVLTLLGVVVVRLRWFGRRSPPPVVAVPQAEPEESRPSRSPSHEVLPSGIVVSDRHDEETDEDRYRKRMEETKKALLEKTRYPVGSQPLATKTDLLKPHHVEPTMRGLSGDPTKPHDILITQNQDRVWISPAQTAVATITATAHGAPVPLTFSRSALTVQLEDDAGHTTPGPVVANPIFLDDGNFPDALPSDGTYSALVVVPPDTNPGTLILSVDAAGDDGEQGTLLFNFIQTAAPPAIFTQTARDALENGSIAIYVGVRISQPGMYEIVGRLYDSGGLPLVYMRFIGQLTTESTEVRLLAFGKVILDEGGVPPFTMEDVDGAEMLIGQYPDRAPMADWAGPYNLQGGYALSQLSNADYDGADKQRKIAALDEATKEGIANIRATPPPAPGPTGVTH